MTLSRFLCCQVQCLRTLKRRRTVILLKFFLTKFYRIRNQNSEKPIVFLNCEMFNYYFKQYKVYKCNLRITVTHHRFFPFQHKAAACTLRAVQRITCGLHVHKELHCLSCNGDHSISNRENRKKSD